MTEFLAGVPFVKLNVDGRGACPEGLPTLVPDGITDLVILSHGWKNDGADATALYEALLGAVLNASDDGLTTTGRRFAVIGVYWPAFRFKTDMSVVEDIGRVEIGGGAASASTSGVAAAGLAAAAREFAGENAAATDFVAAAMAAAGGGGAADAFMDRLRAMLSSADADATADHRDLLREGGSDLVEKLSNGGAFDAADAQTDAAMATVGGSLGTGGHADGRSWRLLSGGRAAVASILNQATYYEMKARAGAIGVTLAAVIDREIPDGVRLHLVGHSFGGRLVSSMATAMTTPVRSLSLLQAAFSHNAFGIGIGRRRVDGGFRRVVADKVVSGPILVTHTRRDTAIGIFYAIASSVSGEIAKGMVVDRLVGGPADLHGGLGANGALSMRHVETVSHVATAGQFPDLACGKVNNVLCDAIIASHCDVTNSDVGRLVWKALSA